MDKIKPIYQNEDKIPEVVKELDAEKILVHQAYEQLRKLEKGKT